MSGMLSTWVVARDVEVQPDDVGPDGVVRVRAVEGWVESAIADYVACSPLLAAHELRREWTPINPAALGRPGAIALSATVSEVLPTSLVLRIRLRPLDGDRDAPVDTQCRLEPVDAGGAALAVSIRVRDEAIALAHAARAYN